MGLAFVSCAAGLMTSSVVRSVALWFVAPVGFAYGLLKAFCFRCCFLLLPLLVLFVGTFWPTGLFCVIL